MAEVAAAPRVTGPEPPRYDLWPVAQRSAWRLSGALVPCGPGLRGIGWPETPRVRLAAVAAWLAADRATSHLTAAWVWGAVREPGSPLQITMRAGARRPQEFGRDVRFYELRCADEDIAELGAFATTTPLRTVGDLLHSPDAFGTREIAACRLLLRLVDGGAETVRARLSAHRRPYRRIAQRRLELL